MDVIIEKINLERKSAVDKVAVFLLDNFGLRYGNDADITLVARDNDNIVATASRTGGVFKYFGILPSYKGMNLSGKLIDMLKDDAFSKGIYHYFIYTSPDKVDLFKGSGFSLVNSNEYAALLESGCTTIEAYLDNLKVFLGEGQDRGAIVMNLNPMTLGHKYLIEEARKKCDELIIFVVEEDGSVFPFNNRIAIIREELKECGDVKVIPGGEYIISKATFPTYFLKRVDDDIIAYTTMDAEIFLKYFAKELNIKKRFLGEEPLDKMTFIYNESLKSILEDGGVEVIVIPRKEKNGAPISASKVRSLIKENKIKEAEEYLPQATLNFLKSKDGKEIIDIIKNN